MRIIFYPLFLLIIFYNFCFAIETCSRVATINYQEVLVDSNSSDKGEGLRYHLEKDPEAKRYLDEYQKKSSINWPNALLGTAGTAALLMGFFESNPDDRNSYLIAGTSIILVNFLVAKTFEVTNEANLMKAIDEYNKRNLPKIYFGPEENRSQIDFFQYKVSVLKNWSF